jgi:hypothetical protein
MAMARDQVPRTTITKQPPNAAEKKLPARTVKEYQEKLLAERERPQPVKGKKGKGKEAGGVQGAAAGMEADQGGGRSRKRSASKRTRRKAKQPSKKLNRKSRRYVRRRRSTRRKN